MIKLLNKNRSLVLKQGRHLV